MKINKKIMLIIAALLIVIAVTIGTVFLISYFNKPKETVQQTVLPTKASADAIKDQAIITAKTADKEKAKQLLEQAKTEYEAIGDKNGVVNMESQIYMLDHMPVKEKLAIPPIPPTPQTP